MKKSPFLYTVLSLAVTVSVALSLAFLTQRQNEPSSVRNSSVPIDAAQQNYAYTLSVYENKLAAFEYGGSEPLMVFDVFLQALPDIDKQELAGGIHVQSYEELIRRIEDYIS